MNVRGIYGFAWLALLWFAIAASPAAAIIPRHVIGALNCPNICPLTATFNPGGFPPPITGQPTTDSNGNFFMFCPSFGIAPNITSLEIISSCCANDPLPFLVDLSSTGTPCARPLDLGILNCTNGCTTPIAPPFRDVMRAAGITVGPGVHGGTGPPLINFTGSVGSAGDTWLTVFDEAPDMPAQNIFTGSVTLRADVRIHTFNNKKGAGLVALFSEGAGQKGLVLIVYDAGNADSLVLATVDQAGKLTTLKSLALGAGILENVWYRLTMEVVVNGDALSVTGRAFRHDVPDDPDSTLGTQVGGTLTTLNPLSLTTLGLQGSGEVGVVATAINAVVDSSVTNFEVSQD